MNDQLYIKIKQSLDKYDFDNSRGFHELFEHSKAFKHGRAFKQFVSICKNMGVYSKVTRTDKGLARTLVYDKTLDKYLDGTIKILERCERCNGVGVVEKPIILQN